MNYQKVRLGDLPIEWKRGQGFRKSDINKDGKNRCVLYGELYTKHNNVKITHDDLSRTNTKGNVLSKKGDVLVPGTSTAAKSQMLLAREISENDIYLGGDINIIRPQSELFAEKYLPYYFQTNDAYEQLERHITGATGIIHISNKGLKELKVPILEIEEQKEIVSILDDAFASIDKAKANIERNIENAKELFQSKLNQIFSQTGEDWEEKTIKDLCVNTSNIKWSENQNREFQYIDLSAVCRKALIVTKTVVVNEKNAPSRAKKIIKEGDVIFATTRPTLRRATIIKKELDKQICSTGFVVLRPGSNISSKWIFFYLLTSKFMERMKSLQRGASYPAVTDNNVKDSKLSVPKSKITEKEFTSIMNILDRETKRAIFQYEQKLDDLEDLKKSILQKAFNGELTNKSVAA